MPPLNALRTFEAAARNGNFVKAGEELNVSSAAVSLQIRNLEKHLGKTLFLRRGNRIFLTDAGETLFPSLASAFDEISQTVDLMQNKEQVPRLVISVLPDLAASWIFPRLAEWRAISGSGVFVRFEDDPVDLLGHGVNLRLTYGSASYEDLNKIPLFSADMIAVCAPSFLAKISDADLNINTMPEQFFIHVESRHFLGSMPDWNAWFKSHGGRVSPNEANGLKISHLSPAIIAAKNGDGVLLVAKAVISKDLESGRLVQLSDLEMLSHNAYTAIVPRTKRNHGPTNSLLNFLKDSTSRP